MSAIKKLHFRRDGNLPEVENKIVKQSKLRQQGRNKQCNYKQLHFDIP